MISVKIQSIAVIWIISTSFSSVLFVDSATPTINPVQKSTRSPAPLFYEDGDAKKCDIAVIVDNHKLSSGDAKRSVSNDVNTDDLDCQQKYVLKWLLESFRHSFTFDTRMAVFVVEMGTLRMIEPFTRRYDTEPERITDAVSRTIASTWSPTEYGQDFDTLVARVKSEIEQEESNRGDAMDLVIWLFGTDRSYEPTAQSPTADHRRRAASTRRVHAFVTAAVNRDNNDDGINPDDKCHVLSIQPNPIKADKEEYVNEPKSKAQEFVRKEIKTMVAQCYVLNTRVVTPCYFADSKKIRCKMNTSVTNAVCDTVHRQIDCDRPSDECNRTCETAERDVSVCDASSCGANGKKQVLETKYGKLFEQCDWVGGSCPKSGCSTGGGDGGAEPLKTWQAILIGLAALIVLGILGLFIVVCCIKRGKNGKRSRTGRGGRTTRTGGGGERGGRYSAGNRSGGRRVSKGMRNGADRRYQPEGRRRDGGGGRFDDPRMPDADEPLDRGSMATAITSKISTSAAPSQYSTATTDATIAPTVGSADSDIIQAPPRRGGAPRSRAPVPPPSPRHGKGTTPRANNRDRYGRR